MVRTALTRSLAVVVVLVGFLVVGCGGDGDEGDGDQAAEPAERSATLLLSYRESPAWIGLLVAREMGYLEEENLSLETPGTDGSDYVAQQVIAGNSKYGMAVGTSAMLAYQEDPSVRALFCNTVRSIFGFAVPEDSEITSIADLEGKKLGFPEQGGGETPLVEAVLKDAGLEPGVDVELIPIGYAGPASATAINDGTVDAYASAYTDIVGLRAGGVPLRDITPDEYASAPGDCIMAKQETLEDPEERDTLVRIARAWSKGSLFAATNPEAALEIGCKQVPQDCTDMDFAEEYMEQRVELITPAGSELGQTEVPYGAVDSADWETAAGLLFASGQTDERIDPSPIIEDALIQKMEEEWSAYDKAAIQEQARSYGS